MSRVRVIVCAAAALALGAIGFGASAHMDSLRTGSRKIQETHQRTHLTLQARSKTAELRRNLQGADPVAARYSDGKLLRPAPPARPLRFAPPTGSRTAYLLEADRAQEALEAAHTSRERAAALLRLGETNDDPAQLRRALLEDALRNTDMAYWIRLRIFALKKSAPDETWVDDVSAIDPGVPWRAALRRSLLKAAGAEQRGTVAGRRRLAALSPSAGFQIDGAYVRGFFPGGESGVVEMRERRIADLDLGEGDLSVPLHEPFALLRYRQPLDTTAVSARVSRRAPAVLAAYGGAALLLIVAAVAALVAIRRAERLAIQRNEFVANVTHELKTPLANIRLHAESLQAGRVAEADQTAFLERILSEGDRLGRLVDGLLVAARGQTPVRQDTLLQPQALLETVEDRWRARLDAARLRLSLHVDPLPQVRGDREALLRALDNLVDNARKYSPSGGRIEVRGARRNGQVVLSVEDEGPGIPVGARRRVLQPFTRLESADRKETEGTGLGLSLAAACVEAHGGRLEIGGTSSGGAVVRMVLPAVAR